MFENGSGAAVFLHKKSITVGKGRVLWAGSTVDAKGQSHAEGWVLPGGLRTNDPMLAHHVATQISEWSQEG